MKGTIKTISISGFKSIRELRNFELRDLNIMIGANGAGKSNFIQIFRLLIALAQKNLQEFIQVNGGADNFLHNGPQHTANIAIDLDFDVMDPLASCALILTRTVNEDFVVTEDHRFTPLATEGKKGYFSDHQTWNEDHSFVDSAISSLMVYHFHDTSATAPMRRSEIIQDNRFLRTNGGNIAPYLRRLRDDGNLHSHYREIVRAIRLVMPFFDDFRLDTKEFRPGEEKVRLNWRQRGSDFPMQPYHLSDGSIRFICLATALLQPDPPSTIVIDEPELGLHPEAIAILAELIQDATERTQVVIATQSPLLLNEFALEDIIVVNRKDGQSTFERLNFNDYNEWLKEYSVGELWAKNVIAGGTNHE